MLSGAFIVATVPARWEKSASVAAALSRIVCAKPDQRGICASVMPSCDCNVRIRWSTAAWVAAEGAGEPADGAVVGTGAVGAEEGGIGAAGAGDCAKPVEGTSKAARATARIRVGTRVSVNISPLLGLAQRL